MNIRKQNTVSMAIFLFFAVLFVLLAARKSHGQEFTPRAKTWWTDASVSTFAAFRAPNITGHPAFGLGLDVGYQINHTVGLHLDSVTYEAPNHWGGRLVDETSLLVKADLINYNKERLVGYVIAGADRDWNRSDWGFSVGPGIELRLTKNLSLGVDSRLRAWFKSEKDLVTRALVTVRF